MKKYLAAAVVAVMVFAFAAFAASLNVDDSTLASGSADVEGCDGTAEIEEWVTHLSQDGSYHVQGLTITGLENCDGNDAIVAFINDAGSPLAGPPGTGYYQAVGEDVANEEVSVTGFAPAGFPPVSDIYGVTVLVKSSLSDAELSFFGLD